MRFLEDEEETRLAVRVPVVVDRTTRDAAFTRGKERSAQLDNAGREGCLVFRHPASCSVGVAGSAARRQFGYRRGESTAVKMTLA
jgi:hypothetical protein